MTGRVRLRPVAVLALFALLAIGCSSSDESSSDTTGSSDTSVPSTTAGTGAGEASDELVASSFFDAEAMATEAAETDCTLDDGATGRCLELTFWSVPDSVAMGPFCPTTIDDPDGGIWVWDGEDGVEAGLYHLNEQFWELMADAGYDFVDADGAIVIADPAAGPTAGGQNACLEATPQDFTITYLVPLTPTDRAEPEALGTVGHVGVAVDGVSIFADAPSVHDTGNLPALDPCGGHVDPNGYYHWHFVSESVQQVLDEFGADARCDEPQSATALFGFAYDGYPLYGPADEDGSVPADLDECNGHTGPTGDFPDGVYHYHASFAAPNLPPCLVGVVAEEHFGGPGGGAQGPPR